MLAVALEKKVCAGGLHLGRVILGAQINNKVSAQTHMFWGYSFSGAYQFVIVVCFFRCELCFGGFFIQHICFDPLQIELMPLQIDFGPLQIEFGLLQIDFELLQVGFTSLQIDFELLQIEFDPLQFEFWLQPAVFFIQHAGFMVSQAV